MAELTVQQQIAQLQEKLRAIPPTFKAITSDTSRLKGSSPVAGVKYKIGQKRVITAEERRLQDEINALMRQFTPGYGLQKSPAEMLVSGRGLPQAADIIQKGLEGQGLSTLGDVSLSVPFGKSPRPVSVENLASRYGMTVPQFLQMNPQYATRTILNPGEVFKVAGGASDLATQLEGQQMRYEANIPLETQRLLSDTGAFSGLQKSLEKIERGRKSFDDMDQKERERLRYLQAKTGQEARDILGGLGNLLDLSGARGKIIARAASRGNLYTPGSAGYGELGRFAESVGTFMPVSLEQAQQALGILPQKYQTQLEQTQLAVEPPVEQGDATANLYNAPQFDFTQPSYNYPQQQPQQPQQQPDTGMSYPMQASPYGGYPQQPQAMYYGGYPQQPQAMYYGGYPQQPQAMYYGGYPQQSNMYGGLGGLGYMSLGGSGMV